MKFGDMLEERDFSQYETMRPGGLRDVLPNHKVNYKGIDYKVKFDERRYGDIRAYVMVPNSENKSGKEKISGWFKSSIGAAIKSLEEEIRNPEKDPSILRRKSFEI